MQNQIIKGTGNSRNLKSAIPANITFSDFIEALRAGTLPIDIGEINPDGIFQSGTPLTKGNLLSDQTEIAAFGNAADRSVNDMFYALTKSAKIAGGSYTGTGTFGSANPNTLDFGFAPRLVIVTTDGSGLISGTYGWPLDNAWIWMVGCASLGNYSPGLATYFTLTASALKWYTANTTGTSASASYQLNRLGAKYNYIAIG